MPRLALAFCLALVRLAVRLPLDRAVAEDRLARGVKGFHGRIGSLPWLAAVRRRALASSSRRWPRCGALLDWPGATLIPFEHARSTSRAPCSRCSGIVGALAAQLSMGDSWRVGVDETETTELVTDGLFAWVRNPIFSFIWSPSSAWSSWCPNALAGGGVADFVGIELQVRAVEEPYLMATHGREYADYAAKAGRFVPGVGRFASARRAGAA